MPIKHTKSLLSFLLISLMIWIISCSEEIVVIEQVERTELDSLDNQIQVVTNNLTDAKIAKDALQRRVDSLNNVITNFNNPSGNNPDVVYTVQVTDGSKAHITGRLNSVPDALVSISQGNSQLELTTDATGMVTFSELESGIISVTVEISGFSDVYMIVDLRDNGTDPDNTNSSYRMASTEVMIFPESGSSTFTISGTGLFNQDLTNLRTGAINDPFHPFQGVDIYETVPSNSDFQVSCIPGSIPLNHTRPGRILQVVYAGLVVIGTADTNGNYSISLPVVLLNDGSNLFSYVGPITNNAITTNQITGSGNVQKSWIPGGFFYPGIDMIFPGGNSFQDVYYFPL